MVVAGNFLRLLLSPSICSKIPSTHSTIVLHPYKTAFFGNLNIDAKQRKTRRCNDNDLERVYNSNRDPWTPGYEVFPTSTGNVFVACIQNEQKLLLPPQLMRTFDGYGEEVCATKSVQCVLTPKFCQRSDCIKLAAKCIKLHGTAFETLGSVQNEDLPLMNGSDEREKLLLKTATWVCLKGVKCIGSVQAGTTCGASSQQIRPRIISS